MKILFETSDGKQFYNEAEGELHEEALALIQPADDYGKALAEAGWTAPALTRMVNAVKQFINWQTTGKVLPGRTAKTKEEDKADE